MNLNDLMAQSSQHVTFSMSWMLVPHILPESSREPFLCYVAHRPIHVPPCTAHVPDTVCWISSRSELTCVLWFKRPPPHWVGFAQSTKCMINPTIYEQPLITCHPCVESNFYTISQCGCGIFINCTPFWHEYADVPVSGRSVRTPSDVLWRNITSRNIESRRLWSGWNT